MKRTIGLLVLLIAIVATADLYGGSMTDKWSLDFTAGGSITGPTFRVIISTDGHVSFQEKNKKREIVKEFQRSFAPSQHSAIQATLVEQDLMHVESQDFTKGVRAKDGGRYAIILQIDDKEHRIAVGMTYKEDSPPSDQERRLRALTKTLNEQLDVNIY